MFRSIPRQFIVVIIALIFQTDLISAQSRTEAPKPSTDWRTWVSANAAFSPAKDWTVTVGALRSFEISDRFKNSFNQFSFRGSYKVNSRVRLNGGVQFLSIPDSRTGTRTRLFLQGQHVTRLGREVNWTNSLQVETNSKQENRFRQRIVLGTRLSLRNRLEFLNLSPSVSYRLFYNIGGDPISYYNEQGRRVARQSPDGFHRHRLQFNANTKLNDYLRINFYFMMQRESNLLAGGDRKMNIPNQSGSRVQRPFDNYNVIGCSVNLDLDEIFDLID